MNVIGTRFGDGFQVLREIGRGALARVYLASDGTQVKAVKLVPPEHGERAERELDIGRDLHHPHLNPVEEGIVLAGSPGVIMPFVPGVRLGRYLAASPGRDAFLDVLQGVLEGLAHLHAMGVVHRDVKPENILVDRAGHARLLDFDLAVRLGDPQPRAVAGTVAYLSPEQSRGEAPTPAADLYGAGILLYWGLTGQVPFTGSVAEVIEAHRSEEPPPPSSVDPALAPFDGLLRDLLAKSASARSAGAREVGAALRELRARS